MRATLLLAAGASRRFGRQDKLAALLGGKPLIRQAIARATAAGAGRLILVGRRGGTSGPRLTHVRARHARGGIAATLAAGLAALRPIEREVLIFLADMPFARFDRRLRLTPGIDAIRKAYDGQPGHPMLIRVAAAQRLLTSGDRGLAALLPRDRLAEIAGVPGDILDIDTPASLRRLRHRIATPAGAFRLRNKDERCWNRPPNGSHLPRR